jgi:hypothetical protein
MKSAMKALVFDGADAGDFLSDWNVFVAVAAFGNYRSFFIYFFIFFY